MGARLHRGILLTQGFLGGEMIGLSVFNEPLRSETQGEVRRAVRAVRPKRLRAVSRSADGRSMW